MDMNDKIDLQRRIEKLQNIIQKKGLNGVFVIQNVNVYYLSGTIQQGFLYIPAEEEPIFFVKRDFERAKKESHLSRIENIKSLKEIPLILKKYGLQSNIVGVELDILPVNNFKKLQEVLPESIFLDFSLELRRLRIVKSNTEIEKMKKAATLLSNTLEEVKGIIKVGMTELEIAHEVEYIARKKGHMGLVRTRAFNQEMFYGHYLTGESAFLQSYVDSPTAGTGLGGFFPQGAGNVKFQDGQTLSIDFVFVYEGYMVDQTRIFYHGKPPEKVRSVYDVTKEIISKVVETAKPGILCHDLVDLVYSIVRKNGLEDIFMGPKGKSAPYIGHGIGLELDELPIIALGVKDSIEENTTFALEPKFFLEPFGLVGLENTYVMTKSGPLLLTNFSEEIQIIL